MNPLFFGTSQRQLYGVYHPPQGRAPRPAGVVLCYPFGQEYMRAHRAYRQLAFLLGRRGVHVFRFDYFGTGDSAGDGMDCTVAQWLEDTGAAVEELRDTAGLETVCLVGLRLGAALAAEAASRRGDLDRLVLWDPIVRGADYVREMERETQARASRVGSTIGINGFPLTNALRGGLGALDLLALDFPARPTFLVTSHARPEFERLAARLRGRPGATIAHVPSPGDWNYVDNFGGVLIPQAIIQAVVHWIAGDANA